MSTRFRRLHCCLLLLLSFATAAISKSKTDNYNVPKKYSKSFEKLYGIPGDEFVNILKQFGSDQSPEMTKQIIKRIETYLDKDDRLPKLFGVLRYSNDYDILIPACSRILGKVKTDQDQYSALVHLVRSYVSSENGETKAYSLIVEKCVYFLKKPDSLRSGQRAMLSGLLCKNLIPGHEHLYALGMAFSCSLFKSEIEYDFDRIRYVNFLFTSGLLKKKLYAEYLYDYYWHVRRSNTPTKKMLHDFFVIQVAHQILSNKDLFDKKQIQDIIKDYREFSKSLTDGSYVLHTINTGVIKEIENQKK